VYFFDPQLGYFLAGFAPTVVSDDSITSLTEEEHPGVPGTSDHQFRLLSGRKETSSTAST